MLSGRECWQVGYWITPHTIAALVISLRGIVSPQLLHTWTALVSPDDLFTKHPYKRSIDLTGWRRHLRRQRILNSFLRSALIVCSWATIIRSSVFLYGAELISGQNRQFRDAHGAPPRVRRCGIARDHSGSRRCSRFFHESLCL